MPHEIRVAIAGVGNCASTLVQGVSYYRKHPREATGLIHHDIAGIKVGDIHFACAFDVDARKVGRRLGEAVFAQPNSAQVFFPKPADDGARVFAGPLADGVARHLDKFEKSRRTVVGGKAATASRADVVKTLRKTRANVLVNYLPVGSQKGTELYAQACLEAGVSMVNCIPVFIASQRGDSRRRDSWAHKFHDAGLVLVGDDVKSQFGATITHRVLMKLAQQRGMKIDSSYQLNVGGNMDFLNMLERARLSSKKTSKTEAVTSQVPMPEGAIHIGPSDYVLFLADNKVCYVRMNMRGFANLPMELDMKLVVEDSPNSAGVVVDAVRCVALARRNGIAGPLFEVSAALMKRPPQQMTDEAAAAAMDEWIGYCAR
jgi:myo-inositol-1-phosphate synthase